MGQWCYVNGNIERAENAKIWITDRGLLYGDGLFETLRIYHSRPGHWEQHLHRLQRGANYLDINIPYSKEEISKAVRELIRKEEIIDGFMRITLTRGKGKRGLYPSKDFVPTLIMEAYRGLPYTTEQYERGFHAAIVSFKRNQFSPLVRWKTLNFLEGILAMKEVKERGMDEGIWLNLESVICEGITSNLFIWHNNVLATPSEECGLLPGIARGQIILLAKKTGIRVEEKKISPDELLTANEAFLTNSLLEAMPLTTVDNKLIGKGKPGPLTQTLARLYRENI